MKDNLKLLFPNLLTPYFRILKGKSKINKKGKKILYHASELRFLCILGVQEDNLSPVWKKVTFGPHFADQTNIMERRECMYHFHTLSLLVNSIPSHHRKS